MLKLSRHFRPCSLNRFYSTNNIKTTTTNSSKPTSSNSTTSSKPVNPNFFPENYLEQRAASSSASLIYNLFPTERDRGVALKSFAYFLFLFITAGGFYFYRTVVYNMDSTLVHVPAIFEVLHEDSYIGVSYFNTYVSIKNAHIPADKLVYYDKFMA